MELGSATGERVHTTPALKWPAETEYSIHIIDDEGDVTAAAEHRGHDARQRHDPPRMPIHREL